MTSDQRSRRQQMVGCVRVGVRGFVLLVALVSVLLCGCVGVVFGSAGRVFELVSPVYKGGFGATFIEGVASNGNGVAFYSPGEFNGAPAGLTNNANGLTYVSRRGVSGWETVPVMPPAALASYVNYHDISPSLGVELDLAKPGPSVEAASEAGREDEFLLHDTSLPDLSENWSIDGGVLKTLTGRQLSLLYQGTSDDFCHLLFRNSEEGSTEKFQLAKSDVGVEQPLYEVDGCGGEAGVVRPVAVNDSGKAFSPSCGSEVGVYEYKPSVGNRFNAVSSNGGEVFFTTCVAGNLRDHQLFVRLGAARTLEVSRPLVGEACGEQQVPCPEAGGRASADFVGASEDGSRVFFTTTAPLVGSDMDGNMDLYMAEIGCPSAEPSCSVTGRKVVGLTQVSSAHNGGEGGVQGVVRVSPDGSRVYFVASSVLLDEAEVLALKGEGRAVPQLGADNLYVYDAVTHRVSFIGDLCSGYEQSGGSEDPRCPSTGTDKKLWTEANIEAQTAGVDGKFLVFSTYAQLTRDDLDSARDVYRYDAETGVLERVSLGEEGYGANGNGPFDAHIPESEIGLGARLQAKDELSTRVVSENGSRIVFYSAQPLSPAATNHLQDVYEWAENENGVGGKVSLLSGGSAEFPVEDVVMAPDGNDVFFVTTQGLVAGDTDGLADIYDARIGGGFPEPPTTSERCYEACQGPLSNPAASLTPGTALQKAGETFTPSTTAEKAKSKKVKKKPKKKAKSKKKGSKARKSGRAGVSGRVR